jgi:hypothetical protein
LLENPSNLLSNNYIVEAEDGNIIIPRRDVIVKCKIYDNNDYGKLKNLVPIKYYKYTIAEIDRDDNSKPYKIIYQSDDLYDGKYQYTIKGLDNYYETIGSAQISSAKQFNMLMDIFDSKFRL